MPLTWDRPTPKDWTNSQLVTFGGIKEGESKSYYLKIIGEPNQINLIFDQALRKYFISPKGKKRFWFKVVLFIDGKFVGKIALVTPYLMNRLYDFAALPDSAGFADPKSNKFVMITVSRPKGGKIQYSIKSVVSKKPISVDLTKLEFPSIESIFTSIPTTSEVASELFESSSGDSQNSNSQIEELNTSENNNDDDDVPF